MNATHPLPDTALRGSIRAEMARQGFTQRDLAGLLGMSQPTVSARMTGRKDFTVSEVRRIAAWLGVPLSRLIAEDAA
jgi:transcriptional regulator with XRE-family HTH domain